MIEKVFNTQNGVIHYRTSIVSGERTWLVFLPGLTADHRLFEKQIEEFKDDYNLFVWDAPGQGCAETEYGRQLMYAMLDTYTKREYCELASHGFRILAEAIEADLAYEISCPALLICGEKDKAGFTKRYNAAWANQSGLPIRWIPGAGHNSNTDKPELVNSVIREFLR